MQQNKRFYQTRKRPNMDDPLSEERLVRRLRSKKDPESPSTNKKAEAANSKSKEKRTTTKGKMKSVPTPIRRRQFPAVAPFELLEFNNPIDHKPDHVNRIFLLNRNAVPEGGPSGTIQEELNKKNYPNMEEAELDGKSMPFLIRGCFTNLRKHFTIMTNRYNEKNWDMAESGVYLTGPGGNGKSYILYYAVHLCRALEWLVVYIPLAGHISELPDEEGASMVLAAMIRASSTNLHQIKYSREITLWQYITDGMDRKDYLNTWKEVISFLRSNDVGFPVLFAIDEWNSKFTHPDCKVLEMFNATINLIAGFWLYAVSSSFDPISYKAFNNDDRNLKRYPIPPYTKEEFESVLKCQQHYKRLPTNLTPDQIECIETNSGHIPRMIFTWSEAWCEDLTQPFEIIRDGDNGFTERAIDYCNGRIQGVLKKLNSDDDQAKVMFHATAADVVLNRKLVTLAPLWEISGLFCKEFSKLDHQLVYMGGCPPVSKAFVRYLKQESKPTIDVLLADPTINWRVLELIFALYFRGSSLATMTFRNKNLLGTIKNSDKQIHISNVVDQIEPIKLLRPGTLIILRPRHPACDFVGYSEKSLELFFIQVSKSDYASHGTKVNNLEDDFEGKSIISYYMDVCVTKEGKRRFTGRGGRTNLHLSLPKDVYYVYLTSSLTSVVTNNSSYHKHPVILVDHSELPSVLGAEYADYVKCIV